MATSSPQKSDAKNLYKPGALFGELTPITQKKWRHSTVFALEKTSLLVFNNYQISKIVKVGLHV